MHIPDGSLSPQTYIPAWGVMAIVWAGVSARLKRTLTDRKVPLLALTAVFCFLIMLFDVPMPGAPASGHAVGAVLAAILLGPSAACIAVTTTVVIQALVFADGGLTAIGANCFNLAFVMPFVGYAVYRLLAGPGKSPSKLRVIAAGVAGYVGMNAGAVLFALELGIQPIIAGSRTGQPLYAPLPVKLTLTAVMAQHLVFYGFVEAIMTALVVAYLQKADPGLLGLATRRKDTSGAS